MSCSEEKMSLVDPHSHDHDHGKLPIILYISGLVLFFIALFLNDQLTVWKNTLYVITIIIAGYHVIILEGVQDTIANTKKYKRFRPNSHILMGLAAIGASLIGSYSEGALLILIFAGAHFLEDYTEGKSRKEITNLMELNPTTARLITPDGSVKVVDVEQLQIGDKLQVLNGDQVPIDGVILSGSTSIDESSISGESIPQEKEIGDEVFASTINGTGTFTMEVTKTNEDTIFSQILKLVSQNQENQTRVATFIQKFEPRYVNLVLIIVPLIMIFSPLIFSWTYNESVYRSLVLLVAASPCALAASTVSVTLSATSNLARLGVLSKGSTYLTQLAAIEAIAFDKTGTLTNGTPEVTDYHFLENVDETRLIDIVVALEKESNHPLANAVLKKFKPKEELSIDVTNQIGKGLTGRYDDKNYRIGKPTSFSDVEGKLEKLTNSLAKDGKTVVYVAEDEHVIGLIAFMDLPNENAKKAIQYFKNLNLQTTMITGDAKLTGEAVAKQLGINEVVANVLPEDKSRLIEEHKQKYGLTAMVGDGVNDAPALVSADVGIAMGEGTDVAVDVADLVLMKNNLSNLVKAHKIAKKMDRVIKQNIFFAMSVVVFLVIVSLFGLTDMTMSVIVHEGSTLVVILNGLRLLIAR